ncbi:MAG: replication protein C, IncQ-type [Bacillota bacterium]
MANEHLTNFPVVKSNRKIHVAPQFRPIRRGRRRQGIKRRYTYKSGAVLDIILLEECDIADQSLLYAILSMCLSEDRGKLLKKDTETEEGKRLREKLRINGDVVDYDSLLLKTNRYELNEEMGKIRASKNREWILQSLKRLSHIRFDYEDERYVWGFNLLSYGYDKKTNDILISINPLSAYVILQNKAFVHVHRGERMALEGDEAKALHSVLCGLVNPGDTRCLNADMLADKVYSRYDEEITDNMQLKRRKAIVDAGKKINKLQGWSVDILGRGVDTSLKVYRRKMKK